jgi:hypothetical protein
MSAPIARVRIKTAERRRPPSGTGRWRPTDPPAEAESRGHEDLEPESTHPPFYPFPLRNDGER